MRAFLQDEDRRQSLALDELEERAAAGGDVGDPGPEAVLLAARDRIPATGEREGLAACDRPCCFARALTELMVLEDADRAIPDDGTRCRAWGCNGSSSVGFHVTRPP